MRIGFDVAEQAGLLLQRAAQGAFSASAREGGHPRGARRARPLQPQGHQALRCARLVQKLRRHLPGRTGSDLFAN